MSALLSALALFYVTSGHSIYIYSIQHFPYSNDLLFIKFKTVQKPRKRSPWTEVRCCFQHGPCAPQKFSLFEKIFLPPITKSNEDCLYLNVFAPGWKSNTNQVTFYFRPLFQIISRFCIHFCVSWKVVAATQLHRELHNRSPSSPSDLDEMRHTRASAADIF